MIFLNMDFETGIPFENAGFYFFYVKNYPAYFYFRF